MKYADCQIGMRVMIHDSAGIDGDRAGTIEKLHAVLTIANPPPGGPRFVTNVVSVRYDEPKKERTPMGLVPVLGVTVDPAELEPLH